MHPSRREQSQRLRSAASVALRDRILGSAALLVVICLAYYPALHGGYVLDDDRLVDRQRIDQAPDGLYRIWFTTEPTDYWPLTNTSLWIEWRLWGMNPTGYHVTNLLLHVAGGAVDLGDLAEAVNSGCISGGGVVCGASGECGIGGVDLAAQEHAGDGVLFAVDLVVPDGRRAEEGTRRRGDENSAALGSGIG